MDIVGSLPLSASTLPLNNNSDKENERCSKHVRLEDEEAIKRELRRKNNRHTTRKLKVKHDYIRQQLEKQVRELEFTQNNLLSKVKKLDLYKQQLEVKLNKSIQIIN